MPQKKAFVEYDPLAGAKIEHYIDTDTNEFLTKFTTEMETCERYAHEKRAAEGKGRGSRYKKLRKDDTMKSIGVAPLTIYRLHPEFKFDQDAPKKFLERNPKLKTTNAKLI